MMDDLRQALRSLRKQWGFAAVAILTLAFGIGVNVSLFLVMLIACANVANLMLSHAVTRRRDLVIRSALGASRFRLIRLQIVESLILSACAGVLGLLLAQVPLRIGASMAAVQGVIGLLLALMGLYAVVSYDVSQRIREIGVRMALGAEPRDVLRLVVREGMRLSLVGIAIGLLVAFGVGLALSRLLLFVSALACYVPARRATRVDPLVALRYE